jgi:hypothetical protein
MSKKGKSRSTSAAEDLLARIVKLDKRERKDRRELRELEARATASKDITDFVRCKGKIVRKYVDDWKRTVREFRRKEKRFPPIDPFVIPIKPDGWHVEVAPIFPEAREPNPEIYSDEAEEGEEEEEEGEDDPSVAMKKPSREPEPQGYVEDEGEGENDAPVMVPSLEPYD